MFWSACSNSSVEAVMWQSKHQMFGPEKSKASSMKCYLSCFYLLFVLYEQTRGGKCPADEESGNKVLKTCGMFFPLSLRTVRWLPSKTGAGLAGLESSHQALGAASCVSLIKVNNLP